ncbi:MAG TPA: NADH-quinone oxidoreductase subunit NuoH [Chloroflexota bacterium]|nr:NADH-quinone oxidoreductase subunit NuoH [Chloroflexota bacterium]
MPSFLNNLLGGISGALNTLLSAVLPFGIVQIILALIGIAVAVTFVALLVMSQIWAERKLIARIQDRVGPNRVGPFGLVQSVADAVKLLGKEDLIPRAADRVVFVLAPLAVIVPSLMIYAVLPFNWDATITRLDIGILYVLALATIPTLGIIMAGWAAYNKYTLLGGMRAAAQLISYEVPEVLSVIPIVLIAGTMSLWGIADAQRNAWFILAPVVGPLAFVTFFISGIAEINRSPFDLPEAESEIIAGFHMEYSGMRFALFFLAEYANAFTVSAIATTLFFGGWQGWILPGYLWFFLKTYILFLVMVWVRGTLPRLRYDQLMAFAWKVLLPITLVNLVLGAIVQYWQLMNVIPWPALIVINIVVVVALYWLYNRLYRAARTNTAPPLLETALAATQGARA